jgi:hypothetical protein
MIVAALGNLEARMTKQVLETSELDTSAADGRTPTGPVQALDKPYASPLVASFALDPHDADSGDALTANG